MRREPQTDHSRTWITRSALAVVTLLGAFLIVFPLATGLPGKSADTGNMMTAFRPQMSETALAQGGADQQTVAAMGQQLTTAMIPALASQMHMTPAQFSGYLATNFPALAKGMTEFPVILPFFGNLQSTMQAQQANYQQADQIPTGFLPPTWMTVLFIVPGAALVLLGAFGFYRPRYARKLLAAGSGVGLLMVVGLLSASMYGKASAADDMTSAFKPVFAAENVQQARAYTDTVSAMSTEFTQKALPAIGTALHLTPAQLTGMMTQNFPAIATGVSQLPQIVQRMENATSLIETNVGNYNQSAAIPWSPGSMISMFWFMMVPALLALGFGAGAVALTGHHGAAAPAAPRMRPVFHS